MIHIRRIAPTEWLVAKRLVYRVAQTTFNDPRPLEEIMAHYDSLGTLDDLLDIETNYFACGGIFLVMFDDDKMICTGAVRSLGGDVCELKRLWLLPEYHGQGLGYRMTQELLAFARAQGYKRMRLETDPISQSRAVAFYEQLGFRQIPFENGKPDEEDILMEMSL
jgi:putative acetyltransferase